MASSELGANASREGAWGLECSSLASCQRKEGEGVRNRNRLPPGGSKKTLVKRLERRGQRTKGVHSIEYYTIRIIKTRSAAIREYFVGENQQKHLQTPDSRGESSRNYMESLRRQREEGVVSYKRARGLNLTCWRGRGKDLGQSGVRRGTRSVGEKLQGGGAWEWSKDFLHFKPPEGKDYATAGGVLRGKLY